MTATYFSLASRDFEQTWTNTGQIGADDDWSGVPSIVGYLGDYTSASPTNVDPRTLTAAAATSVDVIANRTSTAITNGGVAEFEIANPTVALQGSGTADAPNLVIHLNADGRENVTVSYTIRDIDGTADNAVQPVALQYRLSATSAWTNVDSAYVADATTGPGLATSETKVSALLPSEVNGAPTLQLRILTVNAGGNDEWVGIDDILVTSQPSEIRNYGAFSVADASVSEGNSGTTPISFTVSRDGASGDVSVDYAVQLGTANVADFAAGSVFGGTVSFAAGEVSKTVTLQVAADTAGEPNETFNVLLSNAQGGSTIKDDSALGTILNDDPFALSIPEIQGEGHRSAYVGQPILTQGIVTAVDTNGFYLQDAAGDGNARTSDAIFVFTGSAPKVVAGTLVEVRGRVEEFRPGNDADNLTTTQIAQATVTAISTGHDLPAAVLIGEGGVLPPSQTIDDDGFATFDPENDGIDFYESLEGMRVTIDAPLVVSNTNDFAETFVVASGGAGATGVGARGGIAIGDGDYNPEKIQIDDDSGLFSGFRPDYSQGDRLSDVTGVVSYGFESYEVLVTEAVTLVEDRTLVAENSTLDGDVDNLSIANYNLENLDPTDSAQKFDLLAKNIVYNLSAPDIIAVQEIQDADGAGSGPDLSGQKTADTLIHWIQANGGPDYVYIEVAPTVPGSTGGEGGGNIRNGYFYNPDRVSFVEGSARLIEDSAYTGTRRPLVADFEFNGETVTAINVHFTSRLGSDPLWGANQPPVDAGDGARTAQATAVRSYVNNLLATDPELNLVVTGDFNGFYFENASKVLEQGGVLTNLHRLLPEEERYTYQFGGNLQAIDNMLVTGRLLSGARFDAVHINSELPETVFRATDHDAVHATFFIPEPNDAPVDLVIDDAVVAENAPEGSLVGTVSASDADGDTLAYALVDDADGRFAIDAVTGAVTTREVFDHEARSSYEIVARATDPDGASVERALTVSVGDVNEAPVASGDAVAVDEDATSDNLWTTLLGNDSDPDAGSTLSIVGVDQAGTRGSVYLDAVGTLRYEADDDSFDALAPGEKFVDRFTYTVADEAGLTSTATVEVTVTGIADGIALDGGNGTDTVTGTGGEDRLGGGNGDDLLQGLGGHDLLSGGNGADRLFGGSGNDSLSGGRGEDFLSGGGGADDFIFGRSGGRDLVADYDDAADRIVLEQGVQLSRSRVADVDGDGALDLTLSFSQGSTAVLLGIDDVSRVTFASQDYGLIL